MYFSAYLRTRSTPAVVVKLSLLWGNLRAVAEGGISSFIVPGRGLCVGKETALIDLAYQFGRVQMLLFYSWCARSLWVFKGRRRVLLTFPQILSFIQNSAFATRSVFILGLALLMPCVRVCCLSRMVHGLMSRQGGIESRCFSALGHAATAHNGIQETLGSYRPTVAVISSTDRSTAGVFAILWAAIGTVSNKQ